MAPCRPGFESEREDFATLTHTMTEQLLSQMYKTTSNVVFYNQYIDKEVLKDPLGHCWSGEKIKVTVQFNQSSEEGVPCVTPVSFQGFMINKLPSNSVRRVFGSCLHNQM